MKLNGEDSVFDSITSLGGGYGGGGDGCGAPYNGATGSSGGGGTGGGAYSAGSGTVNQGFAGGAGVAALPAYPGGGGGGSGGLGQTAPSSSVIGNGGIGTIVNILPHGTASTINVGEVSGTDVYYGGGGGGNTGVSASGGTGGLGGGADTPNSTSATPNDGTASTGGGGSGGKYGGTPCSGSAVYPKGGSGVVILRYPSSYTLSKTGTLVEATGSPFTEGSDYISVFISGDGTVSFTGSSLEEGTMRENTTTGKMEIYTGTTGWRALQQAGQDVGFLSADNFGAVAYAGNGSGAIPGNSLAQTITVGNGFEADFTMIRPVSHSDVWSFFDSTRDDNVAGGSPYCSLNSQGQEAEMCPTYLGGYYWFYDFVSPGFTLAQDASYRVNISGYSYISFTWKGGGHSNVFNKDGTGYATASGAGLTAGTISPTYSSVNTEAGFSIIRYTGTGSAGTIPHGLGKTCL